MNKSHFFRCLNFVFSLSLFLIAHCHNAPVESDDNTIYSFDLSQLASGKPELTTISATNVWEHTALLFRTDSAHNTIILTTDADSHLRAS
ncbi:hypothetical protein JXQ31_05515 [candidate division KSB1 bacterium]|nr:hypothetical protein [candidate division KSB1 bacterium]